MPEIVYVLTNEAMPDLIKIGRTNGDVADRVRQLDTTGIPLPFECFYAAEVSDANRVERAIHEAFDDHRIRKNREFFRLSPEKPKAIIELLCIRNVTPGYEIFTEPDDQAAVSEAKNRRARFSLSKAGLRPGAVLRSLFDENITCTVRDEKKVDFRGEEFTLSASALIIAREKGYGWTTISGPNYWKFEGTRLSDLQAKEDESAQA